MNYQALQANIDGFEGEHINFAYVSKKDESKQVKEDSFVVLAANAPIVKNNPKGNVFAVMDGLGGQEGGLAASSFLQKSIGTYFSKPEYDGPEGLHELLKYTHTQFQSLKSEGEIPETSGSTLSLILLYKGDYHIFHTGDSRIYLQRDGSEEINQITTDWHNQGLINYFGQPELTLERKQLKQEEYDKILLMTDGLYESLDERTLKQIILEERNSPVKEITKTLFQRSRQRGSLDDLTLIVAELLEKI